MTTSFSPHAQFHNDGESAPNSESAAPRKKSRKRKLPKVISAREASALLRAAETDTQVTNTEALRNKLILEFMYRAGLRVSEVINLKVRDVEPDGVIRLYAAKGGDGTAYFDAERLTPTITAWLAIRQAWAYSDTDTPFFCRPDGRPMTVRYVQRLVKRLKDQIGIAGICTPHVLRHTFATELIEEGFPIHEVQAAVRHANLATTAVYLHVRDESLRRKIARRSRPQREEG